MIFIIIVSDANISALISAITLLAVASALSIPVSAATAYFTYFFNKKARIAKEESDAKFEARLEEIKNAEKIASKKIEELSIITDDVHDLVNSDMGKRILKEVELTKAAYDNAKDQDKDRVEIEAKKATWETAKTDLVEHEKRQAIVDDRLARRIESAGN